MPLTYTVRQMERKTIIAANFDTKTLQVLPKHYLCVDQNVWDLWWTKWQLGRLYSQYFGFAF